MSGGHMSGEHMPPQGEQLSQISETGGLMSSEQMSGVSKCRVSKCHPLSFG